MTDHAYPPSVAPTRGGIAFGWNVLVIIVGSMITLAGVGAAYLAAQQVLVALWLLIAAAGALIAAVGILGAALVSVLRRD